MKTILDGWKNVPCWPKQRYNFIIHTGFLLVSFDTHVCNHHTVYLQNLQSSNCQACLRMCTENSSLNGQGEIFFMTGCIHRLFSWLALRNIIWMSVYLVTKIAEQFDRYPLSPSIITYYSPQITPSLPNLGWHDYAMGNWSCCIHETVNPWHLYSWHRWFCL